MTGSAEFGTQLWNARPVPLDAPPCPGKKKQLRIAKSDDGPAKEV